MELNQYIHNNKERQSGVEALKVIAVVCIILSHVIQTLCTNNSYILYDDYILDLSEATLSLKLIGLQFLRSFGVLGNHIFFVCSAWFLLDSNRINTKKWFHMLLEVWTISILFTVGALLLMKDQIPIKLLIKCFFPTTFANNWYMTCYLLFYPLHTMLNRFIGFLNQKTHFRLAIASFVVYFVANSVISGLFFPSSILLWMGIYIIVGYMKKYMGKASNNIKVNVIVLSITFVLFFTCQIVWNCAGIKFSFLNSKMLHWNSNYNPFWLISALCMLNIARNLKFENNLINYISGLSLEVYLIHENILVRTYFRPYVFDYLHHNYGYEHVYLIVFAYTIALFLASLICAIIYRKTIGRLVKTASARLHNALGLVYTGLENKII